MLHNPSSLYSEGSAVVNSQPATQFYLQSMAKKRAKEDALDNYYRDFQKTVNPAGMRNVDIEGFMQKKNDWENFYQQNKQAIENPKVDNGRAYSEFMNRHNDLLSDTQRSKNAAEITKGYVLPLITNPDKRNRITDLAVQSISKHDASIYDPNHQDLNPTALDFDAKDFGLDAQKKFTGYISQGLKMDEAVQKITVDPKTHSKTISYEYTMNPQALQTAASRAIDVYNSDHSFQQYIDNLSDNPDTFDKLNKVFKEATGKDISNHQEFAAAYGLDQIQKQRSQEKLSGYNPYLGQRSSGSGSGYSSNGSNQQFNNVYGDIDEAVNAGNGMAKVSDLNIVGAGIISDVLRKRTSNPNEAANIINDGAYIKRGADGILRFHSKDDRISFPVTYKDINTIANTTAKGDNAVLNTTPKPEKPGKKKTIAELMREAASKPK